MKQFFLNANMHVIFLDVDGVLNNLNSKIGVFEESCMSSLKKIVDNTNAKIVLSTSWRDSHSDVGMLLSAIDKAGIDVGLIVGSTPHLWQLSGSKFDDDEGKFINKTGDEWTGSRGHEIFEWIKMNNILATRFVILDDDPLAAQLKVHDNTICFVHCNDTVGLTEEDADKAIDFLNRK